MTTLHERIQKADINRAVTKALKNFDNEHHHICPACAEHAACNRVDCGGYVKVCQKCGEAR